jgi:hypothetical protein
MSRFFNSGFGYGLIADLATVLSKFPREKEALYSV